MNQHEVETQKRLKALEEKVAKLEKAASKPKECAQEGSGAQEGK